MIESEYRYCPRCATPLERRLHVERERTLCGACGWVHWDNPLPVLAALVEFQGRILLARNAAWSEKIFALITGFMERDETPLEGLARELKEETNLDVAHATLIGVYEFKRKNEVIIAYHVQAEGTVQLGPELVDYRLIAPEKLRPWRLGTGLAMADWMRSRNLPVEFIDLPERIRADEVKPDA
ncbi:MAG: NUDIX hydrolase [Burkholderiaceae bacterium]|jgi:NADH pyrophosphatase NudC (nudix superfamily)